MSTHTTHPQAAEVSRLLAHLIAHGFALHSIDDGGDTYKKPTADEAAGHILGVDDSMLYVTHPDWSDGRARCIFIVLGNGPGELASDFTDREPLTSCLEKWSDEEEERAETERRGLEQGRAADYNDPRNDPSAAPVASACSVFVQFPGREPRHIQTVPDEAAARRIVEARNRAEIDAAPHTPEADRAAWSYSILPPVATLRPV